MISRLIGTPQIACACASSAARSVERTGSRLDPDGILRWQRQLWRVHVQRISVGTASAHLQRPEHVGRTAREASAAASPGLATSGRWSTGAALAAAPPAHHDEEVLEDAWRQEGGKPVVLLIQAKAVQIARRRLKVVARASGTALP